MFLLVSGNKRVIGCVIAEMIEKAFEIVSDGRNGEKGEILETVVCSKQPLPAKIGISRIWTLSSQRRKGIGRKLLDVVRENMCEGIVVPKKQVAMTQPTSQGRMFATKYFEKSNFLVYQK